jgi:ParB family chromosome partitioning protein
MVTKRRGLGRGLAQLIPGANSTPNQNAQESLNISTPEEISATQTVENANSKVTKSTPVESNSKSSSRTKLTTKSNSATRQTSRRAGIDLLISGKPKLGDVEVVSELMPTPGAKYAEIKLTNIVTNAQQPREVFDDDDLAELVASIKEFGVIQPARVREQIDKNGLATGKYELIAGERRWRASKLAGNTTLPVIVADVQDDDMLSQALTENLNRVNLNPLEVASAYRQLIDDFGLTQEQLSQKFGKSRPVIANTLRLLNLPLGVQKRVAAGVLSEGHAKSLAGLKDIKLQEELANRVVQEGLSVRAVEEQVSLLTKQTKTGDDSSDLVTKKLSQEIRQLPDLALDVQQNLSDYLDTVVQIKLSKSASTGSAQIGRGQIVVDFADELDLQRLNVAIINS